MSDLFKSTAVTVPDNGPDNPEANPSVTSRVTEDKCDGKAVASATPGFCWRSNEDIVCRRQPATACYRNVNEMVVIRQEADWDEEQDTIVILADETVPKLIRALTEQIDDPNGSLSGAIHDALWKHGL